MDTQGQELWNTTEVARFLGIKPTSASSYRHRGHLPPPVMTVGKQTHLWDADTIRAWQAARQAKRGDQNNTSASDQDPSSV